MGAKITLFSFGLAILLCLGALAGERPAEMPKQVPPEAAETGDQRQTASTLFKLNHLVDLWHDANLKGNTRSIDQYEAEIFELLRKDIRVSHRFVDHRLQELRGPDKEDGETGETPTSPDQDLKSQEDWQDLEVRRRLLSTKKRLVASMTRTYAFSNKFRLLGDYREILRRELDMSRLELVKELEESEEDFFEEFKD